MLGPYCAWIESQPISNLIASSYWLFPAIESAHVLALTLVIGTIVAIDFRLMGLAGMQFRVSAFARHLLTFTWCAFAVAVITGALLFISQASVYCSNLPFGLKLTALAAAGLNMAVFHAFTYRRVDSWDVGPPPTAARAAGAVSATLWVSVVLLGRWIAFV